MPTATDTATGSAPRVVRAQVTVGSLVPVQDQRGGAAVSLLITDTDGHRPAAVSGDVTPAPRGIGR